VSNLNEEFREVVDLSVFAYFGEDHDIARYLFEYIRYWMNRKGIVLYQP
jgi:hypothetical protein